MWGGWEWRISDLPPPNLTPVKGIDRWASSPQLHQLVQSGQVKFKIHDRNVFFFFFFYKNHVNAGRLVQGYIITEWSFRPSTPTADLTLQTTSPSATSFKYLQGWWPHHCPGQPIPVPDHPLWWGNFFPNIQSQLPWHSLRLWWVGGYKWKRQFEELNSSLLAPDDRSEQVKCIFKGSDSHGEVTMKQDRMIYELFCKSSPWGNTRPQRLSQSKIWFWVL